MGKRRGLTSAFERRSERALCFCFDPAKGFARTDLVAVEIDQRKNEMEEWLRHHTSFSAEKLELASSDASFRRYFRLWEQGKTWIVMDAPPDLEPCEPFVRIGTHMREREINVPKIIAHDLKRGFMVLSDFGDGHFQDLLEGPDRDELYDLAISEIFPSSPNCRTLPKPCLRLTGNGKKRNSISSANGVCPALKKRFSKRPQPPCRSH